MKIGPVEIYFRRGNTTVGDETLNFLNNDQRVQSGVSRMARSEVKNYLAELAEDAEMPFSSPEAFLRLVRTKLAAALLAERHNVNPISLDELEERRLQAKSNMNLVNGAFGLDEEELDHIVRSDN